MAEGEVTRRVYLVVERFWTYNDEYFTGADTPMKAFSTPEQAEAYLDRCRALAREVDLRYTQSDLGFTIVETELGV